MYYSEFFNMFFYESYLMLINVRIVKWKLFYYFYLFIIEIE